MLLRKVRVRPIRKLSSDELLTKQEMKENFIIYKKITYTLKVLLNAVTSGIEELVISGSKFFYTCIKGIFVL